MPRANMVRLWFYWQGGYKGQDACSRLRRRLFALRLKFDDNLAVVHGLALLKATAIHGR